MTDKARQTWSIAGQFSTVVALLAVAATVWQAAAGFTKATVQNDQLFQQNAQIFQMMKQDFDEQLKVLRQIEEKLDRLNTRSRERTK
ncbi:MAG TPA: hypothetical protein VF290_18120 [Pyrinomonadaceae bacterium]